MSIVCPTVTAFDEARYRSQMELLDTFANRIHIDLMDGQFAPTISPALETVWWPEHLTVDMHLMYQQPMKYLKQLIKLHPSLVIIHFEAEVNHVEFTDTLHAAGIKTGLALLQTTTVATAQSVLPYYDHVMIFSGNLGRHGGSFADLQLLQKAEVIQALHPTIELGWDGGVNSDNIVALAQGGIEVLNVGGYIHKSLNPVATYKGLQQQLGI